MAVANPAVLMVATPVLDDVHVAELVKSCWLASLKVPVAVNCCFWPAAIDGFPGVTDIDTRMGGPTLTLVDPVTLPDMATIFAPPSAIAFAKPELLIVTVAGSLELQATDAVKSRELPSLNCPRAVNCCDVPLGRDLPAGLTAIETNSGGFTVSVVEAFTLPDAAPMELWPCARAVANPDPLMVATPALEDVQVTELVKSCVL
jgi:hypothetical protein